MEYTVENACEKLKAQAERLSVRSMSEEIVDYLMKYCEEDPDILERIHNPDKSFLECMEYIKIKALEWLMDEKKVNVYDYAMATAGNIPAEHCFEWAIEYYYSRPGKRPDLEEAAKRIHDSFKSRFNPKEDKAAAKGKAKSTRNAKTAATSNIKSDDKESNIVQVSLLESGGATDGKAETEKA